MQGPTASLERRPLDIVRDEVRDPIDSAIAERLPQACHVLDVRLIAGAVPSPPSFGAADCLFSLCLASAGTAVFVVDERGPATLQLRSPSFVVG